MCATCGCDVQTSHSPSGTAAWKQATSAHPQTQKNSPPPGTPMDSMRGVTDKSGLGQHAQGSGNRQLAADGRESQLNPEGRSSRL